MDDSVVEDENKTYTTKEVREFLSMKYQELNDRFAMLVDRIKGYG
jgi:hypothetical protein